MSFLFINGQIRAMESRLLNVNRLDRMIGARTPDEAFRVLTELEYAEFVDEGTTANDFYRIIEKGLYETKDLIVRGTGNHPGLQFLWRRADVNNLKRAFKMKLLQKKTEIGTFSEENGFSSLGDINPKDIEKIVFTLKYPEDLPVEYIEACENASKVFEHKHEFRFVEFLFDKAHFSYLAKVARKAGSSFLKSWLELQIDAVNIRSLARSILILDEKLSPEAFIEGGTFSWEKAHAAHNMDILLRLTKETAFRELSSVLMEHDSHEDKLLKIERECDRVQSLFLHDAQSGQIDTIQVSMAYFERRLQNSRMLKFIMFAKFHGLSSENILKTLKHL
ncbi:V-type ATPase subunit [Candidatus Gracilibacteria bacterium]|nr:V-type ATPase subunit [Candidatus Gracilibacteria bacterium]